MKNEKEQHQETLSVEQTTLPKQEREEKEHERKQLSLQEREKLKKAIIFSILGILFVLSIWLIFAPSTEDKKKTEEQIGLNNDIPQASNLDLPDDKLKAYSLGTDEEKKSARQGMLGSLYDYFDNESEKQSTASNVYGTGNDDPVAKSVSQYQATTRMLQSFNEPPAYDAEKEELWNKVNELQTKLSEIKENKNDEIDQLALMEKSYQMASKYLPQSQQTAPSPFTTAKERPLEESFPNAHTKAEHSETRSTVTPERKSVVSTLYQTVSDSAFIAEQSQERNRYFHSTSAPDDALLPEKNTLRVSVYQTTTVKDGETLRLRLLESAQVANMLIPKNTLLTAVAKIQGNRLSLSVTSIEFRERIIAVKLSAYDLEGQLGIFIPGSEEMNAVKEVVAGMGQTAGTSFTLNASAGQQLAADAGKGVMQGASQYLNKKMREVKVTVKAGHLLYLITNP